MMISDLKQFNFDKCKWPNFIGVKESTALEDSNSFEIDCEIPSNLSWFKGHFPDQAVLPGVVQLNWANNLSMKLFKVEGFKGVNSLKFNTMILPETTVTLVLTFNPEKHSVKFNYNNEDILFSSGVLMFASSSH